MFTYVRGDIVFAVRHRVPEPTADASDCRIHGATVPVAVRGVDGYHQRLDSASRAPRLLKSLLNTGHIIIIEPSLSGENKPNTPGGFLSN